MHQLSSLPFIDSSPAADIWDEDTLGTGRAGDPDRRSASPGGPLAAIRVAGPALHLGVWGLAPKFLLLLGGVGAKPPRSTHRPRGIGRQGLGAWRVCGVAGYQPPAAAGQTQAR
ncbi:hypothetical protein Ntsu_68630 [Nocardia sp. IFM 10818]